ncbi:unnamed protein product [Microthlaspi erraticum]|uniref:Zinc finger GRF-type domain-containing protein n=1 Tax=Microthlaspi erraticum TaxID=1685480 RepID=A0A6D2J0X5_9BRAS|nr:unnamed protein product [Microthlaspi erraticum]
MGPHSWVETSSSSVPSPASLDPGLLGEYEDGIPHLCYCGGSVFVETTANGDSKGMRFVTCRRRDEAGHHIRKLWDNCVEEEIEMLRSDITSLKEDSRTCAHADEALKEISILWTDLLLAEKKTRDLKEDLEMDIVKIKEDFLQTEVLVRDLLKEHKTGDYICACYIYSIPWSFHNLVQVTAQNQVADVSLYVHQSVFTRKKTVIRFFKLCMRTCFSLCYALVYMS